MPSLAQDLVLVPVMKDKRALSCLVNEALAPLQQKLLIHGVLSMCVWSDQGNSVVWEGPLLTCILKCVSQYDGQQQTIASHLDILTVL